MSAAREFAVRAEGLTGKALTLRRGFATLKDAEDHPVVLKNWRRVWIEEVEPPPAPRETLPARPWDTLAAGIATANNSFHLYIIDATGRKIAAIWGKGSEKSLIAETIVDLVNKYAPEPA